MLTKKKKKKHLYPVYVCQLNKLLKIKMSSTISENLKIFSIRYFNGNQSAVLNCKIKRTCNLNWINL